jgi:hypothetical protein
VTTVVTNGMPAFTQKTYVHASDEDLQRGQAALARIHKIA